MPRSKHHKKKMSASKWRKLSNIRRALRKYLEANDGDIPDWFIENHFSDIGRYKKKINVVGDKRKKSKYRKVKNV
jgi:hypothetical protein|tara:strand:+ start:468 stop:692 length:225 start_codon:yes stop_codon:yes gene_type:complete